MDSQKTTQTFSKLSMIALISAVLTFALGNVLGFIFAGCAFVFGILGMIRALSEKKRGGIVSFFSTFAGLIGIIAGIVKGVLWLI